MLAMSNLSTRALWIAAGGVVLGILVGVLVGAQPLFLGLGLGAILALVCFFAEFERTVLGLLILRSALDSFSAQQIPAVYAVGLDTLTLLYVVILLLTRKTVKTDQFWWFFAVWVGLQGTWLILMPLGGLGLDVSFIGDSLREWVRLFSWLMIYLLVMQLRGNTPPQKIVSALFLALILPLTVATLQTVAPSILPSPLSGGSLALATGGKGAQALASETSRISGTLGLANSFATYLLLFIGLTWWKINRVTGRKRWPWFLLMAILAFFFVGTKSLFSLMMLAVFVLVLVSFRANFVTLLSGVFLFALVLALFSSTEFGQARLASLFNTPILNPDIDVSRAILIARRDYNSFNWRISQWTYLLQAWQNYPYLGYGLGTSIYVSTNKLLPHNDYVRALVEGGIAGFTTFILFLFAQIFQLVQRFLRLPKESAQRSLCVVLFALMLAVPVGMLTENIWSHTTFFFYWWTLFALAGWDWKEKPLEREAAPPKFLPVTRTRAYRYE